MLVGHILMYFVLRSTVKFSVLKLGLELPCLMPVRSLLVFSHLTFGVLFSHTPISRRAQIFIWILSITFEEKILFKKRLKSLDDAIVHAL